MHRCEATGASIKNKGKKTTNAVVVVGRRAVCGGSGRVGGPRTASQITVRASSP
jgi:hypothetical protein